MRLGASIRWVARCGGVAGIGLALDEFVLLWGGALGGFAERSTSNFGFGVGVAEKISSAARSNPPRIPATANTVRFINTPVRRSFSIIGVFGSEKKLATF